MKDWSHVLDEIMDLADWDIHLTRNWNALRSKIEEELRRAWADGKASVWRTNDPQWDRSIPGSNETTKFVKPVCRRCAKTLDPERYSAAADAECDECLERQ